MKDKLSVFSPLIMIIMFSSAVMATIYIALQGNNIETTVLETALESNKFNPDILEADRGRRIKIYIHNKDDNIEEFESTDLNREKIVPAHSTIKVIVGPLEPGEYGFFGDFSPDTAAGVLKIK